MYFSFMHFIIKIQVSPYVYGLYYISKIIIIIYKDLLKQIMNVKEK